MRQLNFFCIAVLIGIVLLINAGCTNHAELMKLHQQNEMQRLTLLSQLQPTKAFEMTALDPNKPIVLENIKEFVVYGPSPIRGDDFRMSNYQAPPNEALQWGSLIIGPAAMLGGQWVSGHYDAKRWGHVTNMTATLMSEAGYKFNNHGSGNINFTGGTGDRIGDNWQDANRISPFGITPYVSPSGTSYWETQP